MVDQDQVANKGLSRFLGRRVKIVYKESSGYQIGKGTLDSIDKGLLILNGDFSLQAIPIESIIKVSSLHDSEDHDAARTN